MTRSIPLTPRSMSSARRGWLFPALLVGAWATASCAGPGAESTASPNPQGGVAAVSAQPAPDNAQRAELSGAAADLQALFNQIPSTGASPPRTGISDDPTGSAEPHPGPAGEAHRGTDGPRAGATAADAGAHAVDSASSHAEPAPPPAVPSSGVADTSDPSVQGADDAERLTDLAARLADLLRRRSTASPNPLADALALEAILAAEPGAAGLALPTDLDATLSSPDRESLAVIRGLLSDLRRASPPDPAGVADLLRDHAGRLAGPTPLTIPAALLCRRVDGYGRYTPFETTAFLAGKPAPAILYVEAEHFGQRTAAGETARDAVSTPAGAGSGGADALWSIELGQEVSLYHDPDGLLAWHQPEQLIRESARRRRHDFYLVQRIDLPAALSVGRYNLKVRLSDKVSGATAEAVVPIHIVADPALAARPSGGNGR